jgi:hypothetical protein
MTIGLNSLSLGVDPQGVRPNLSVHSILLQNRLGSNQRNKSVRLRMGYDLWNVTEIGSRTSGSGSSHPTSWPATQLRLGNSDSAWSTANNANNENRDRGAALKKKDNNYANIIDLNTDEKRTK